MHYRLDSHIAPDYLQASRKMAGKPPADIVGIPVHNLAHNIVELVADRHGVVLYMLLVDFPVSAVDILVRAVLVERPVWVVQQCIVGPAAPVNLVDRRMEQREDKH